MRRSVWTVVGGLLAVVAGVLPVGGPAGAAPAPATASASAAGRWVQLPTGEDVLVRPDGSVQVRPPASAGWPGAEVVRVGTSTVVLPLASLPELGRTLDPSAFDVTTGAAAGGGSRLEASAAGAVPTVRLRVRVLDDTGAAAPYGTVVLGNTDDATRYTGLLVLTGREQQVTVPVGHYSAVALVSADDGERMVSRSDLDVRRDGQLLLLDARDAVVRPAVTTPQPARLDTSGALWARTDATGRRGFGVGTAGARLRVAPAPAPATGSLRWSTTWSLSGQRSTGRPYTYDAIFSDPDVPRAQDHRPGAAAFADVVTRYRASGGRPTELLIGRLPFAPGQTAAIGVLKGLRAPLVRDEHVLAPRGGFWVTSLEQLDRGRPVVDWFASPVPTYRPGQQAVVDWLRPAELPRVLDDGVYGLDCGACRHGDRLDIGVAPLADADPSHVGLPWSAASGPPRTRLRLFRGSTLLATAPDAVSVSSPVPAADAAYRLVADTDLPTAGSASATSSHSEITFRSGRDVGAACGSGGAACRVLPLLQVRAALPVDLLGQLPVGGAAADLSVTHVRGAPRTPVRDVTVSVRTGTSAWRQLPAVVRPDGSVHVMLPAPRAQAGRWVDLRITARDTVGGTLEQTLTRAYRIAT